MTDGFPTIAFQSCLAVGGILFGVFGFLYTLYGMYKPQITPTNLQQMPIVPRLKQACRVITFFIIIDTLLMGYAVYVMYSYGLLVNIQDKVLAFGLGGIVVLIALVCLIGAVSHMD